jgi:hypothetical protein
MSKYILALLFTLLIAACGREAGQTQADATPDNGDGRLYIHALADALRAADRVVVTEHSNAYDLADAEGRSPQRADYVPIVYATHELTAVERAAWFAAISNLAARTQDADTACTFEPHHTLTFFHGAAQSSAMQICFQCGQVEWDGTTKMRPWSLVPALKTLISSTGMKADRDWGALARRGAQSATN